jgi:alpha-beta hydrolase superfamily lysophospholipase
VIAAALGLGLTACAGGLPNPTERPDGVGVTQDGEFRMADGTVLPYRRWLPAGPPDAVILALHGFNDSRDAWEIPGADFAAAGFAVYAPDQRGFGTTAQRGLWPGTAALVADAAEMAAQLRARHRDTKLVLMGESMGGAILMNLATGPLAPRDVRYVLVAPAVWGRARMNVFLRGSLWLAATLAPAVALSGAPVRVMASDNRAALIRLSHDPLTIRRTRFDTLRGLVDLMDAALAAAPAFTAPGLFLYGAHDALVPKDATAAMWRRLPRGAGSVLAYYPADYHLILRDLGRAEPIGDVVAWLRRPAAELPSGADARAADWLARQGT